MRARWQGNCLWAVAMLVVSVGCHAQSSGSLTPEDEYRQLIKVNQDIQPLGAHPFGENISLYDGSVSFEETDITVPGNGPTIQLQRSLAPEVSPGPASVGRYPFGDWDLNIPRIETITANPAGWLTSTAGSSTGGNNRCSNFTPPPYAPSTVGGGGGMWPPSLFWYGYHLLIPGHGSQELMPRATANALTPTMNGMSFSIVTKSNWMIGCGVTASDGGEGFLAIAPDGTRYTFAHLIYRPAATLSAPAGIIVPPPLSAGVSAQNGVQPMVAGANILYRSDALMYVTQIQDRFGNTLTYNYDPTSGYLTSITASDGRAVTLNYANATLPELVTSIVVTASNASPRTWTYSYDTNGGLTGVQLPDGSAWSYSLGGIDVAALQLPLTIGGDGSDCESKTLPTVPTGTVTGSITHPSGLTATFTMTPMLRGRSYVPWVCYGSGYIAAVYPEYDLQYSMTSEVLSGAGMPTETWNYGYSPTNESWSTDACATSGTCPTTVYTDVTDPGGNDTRYTFSNRFDATEGQLLRTDYYSGAASGTLMRSVANTYANPTGGPWPTAYGTDLQGRDNTTQTTETSPLQQRTTTQDGQTYTWQALGFDAYTQPTDVKRYNTIAGQSPIEETTTYLNDTNTWVLGLPQTVTNKGTGEVETSNTYNSLDELTARARFGETLMNYTWNSAGQLASFTDGNSHTTSLSSYYRGIPRSIGYPDGTSESLAVDDLGQITSITDQAGHTTSYSYDPVGRIARITYPYDSSTDSASWYPKVFTYAYVTSAERGVGADHWRRITTQGSATDTTYFDAELRPVLDDTSNGSSDISTATGYDWRSLTTLATYPVAGSPALSALTTGTHSTYDALGRLTQSQQDSELGLLTTTTQYVGGPGTQVTDPKGNVTTTYDQAFDQPVYNVPWSISAPDGVTQSITRDIYGEPTAITQSGPYGTGTLSFTKSLYYDSYHRLCRTTEPETGSTVMAYDAANNLLWSAEGQAITESGCGQDQVATTAQTTRTYDGMNRVLTIVPPSGTQSTTYTYDAMGRVQTAVSGIATQGFAYNSLGSLTNESLQVSGFSWALGYGYDAYGHRSTVTYPAGTGASETVNYAPDAWGRPTQAGNYATGIGYFPNGQVESFTYGNGRSYVAQQNTRQLTSNFSDGAGSTLDLSEDLTYDADGNITAVNDLASGLRSKSFGYDALNRLTSATASNLYGTESYTYDPINNLRTRLTGGQTLTYNYDVTNKLSSITQGATTVDSLTYNPQGDTIGENSTTLAFDAKHQLTGLPGVESYSYDAAGRRVVKQPASGSPTYYFYNQAGQLMYQYAPGTATTTNYIYLGTHLIAQHDHVQLSVPGAISFGTNPTAGSSTVSWGSSPPATSYTLQQSGDGGSTWSTVYTGSATGTTVSGLVAGGYTYRVQGCAGSNCSGWTTSATLGVWPAIPTVSVPAGTINGPYTVSWNASVGATGYTVQESVNGGAWSTVASNTTTTSISRPGTTTGSYTYQVEASNAYGTAGWSATSAAVSVNTAYGVVPTPVPSLTVPAASSTGSATISWTAASPLTGYTLQQSSNGGSSWTTVYSGTATSAALSGLANGSYSYQVQACNDTAGNSVCTAWATGGTLVVTLPPAGAPSLSVPANSTTGSYTVSWGSVATATSYTLQLSSNGGSSWSTATSGSATSWGASGQGNGSYVYRVQACNVGGCSAWSSTGTTTVLLPPASAPSLSVPASNATGSYTVSWGAVGTATSYTLQRSIDSGGWGTVQSSSATSWAASGQATGTYAYQVQACNASGCGPWSSTGTTNVLQPPASAPSLSVPASNSTGSYTVSWGAVATASSYTLQENANGGGWSTVQSSSATSWSTSGRGDGSYAYQVQACNASGCGPWSSASTVAVMLVPATPTLTVNQSHVGSFIDASLTWTAEPTATTYVVQEENGATITQVYSGSGTTWSGGYAYGALRSFRVEACNSAGCSPWAG